MHRTGVDDFVTIGGGRQHGGKISMRPQMSCPVAMTRNHHYGAVSHIVLVELEHGVWLECLPRRSGISIHEWDPDVPSTGHSEGPSFGI